MQLIPVLPSSPAVRAGTADGAVEAMAGMVGCLGSGRFGQEALAQMNRWLPVSWWSVFRIFDDAPPCMPISASHRVADGTAQAWQAYRSALYRDDQTFVAARERAGEHALLVHWHAREIPRVHREPIYTRHGLRERLSIVRRDPEGSALTAINLYRHETLPAFSDDEFEWLGSGAVLLDACVRRHLQLAGARDNELPQVPLAGLTRREREVCERMLRGWTYDGIAADLGISAGTVKTYRDRAFERLDIHHRNELFALAIARPQ